MIDSSFFEESSGQSKTKAKIVSDYFYAWMNVMSTSYSDRIAYLDLFSGPGRYIDGTKSTPLLILEKAISNPKVHDKLVTLFNDYDPDSIDSLAKAINNLSGLDKLKYKPDIISEEINSEFIKRYFEEANLIPSFTFIDPWGYKGLSLKLINSVLKDWGCDTAFFFNYNRINMGITNPHIKNHMKALFGEERLKYLQDNINDCSSIERERLIIETLKGSIKEMGGEYVIPFKFLVKGGTKISHFLIFISKHSLGYEIMKDIMAINSTKIIQGVSYYEYSDSNVMSQDLFERPLDDLVDMLLNEYSGMKMSMLKIYKEHHVEKPYIKKNYKEALIRLEKSGKISADPPEGKRKIGTFSDRVIVTFL